MNILALLGDALPVVLKYGVQLATAADPTVTQEVDQVAKGILNLIVGIAHPNSKTGGAAKAALDYFTKIGL